MSPDIKETLSRGAPEPLSRLDVREIARRGRLRQRRNRTFGIAGIVLLVGIAVPLSRAVSTFMRERTAASLGLVTYRDPSDRWKITYPARFDRGGLPSLPRASRITYDGVWVANFDSPDFDPGPVPSEIPHTGVFIEVFQRFGGPAFIPQEPDAEFPISYGDLKVERGLYSGERRTMTVTANGEAYTIVVGIGKDASVEDRQAVPGIVSSLRFLPLETGSTTGRHPMYFVLDNVSAYPIGSVSRFDASNLPESEYEIPPPFYLVHVRQGFYALAWRDDLQGGYKDCGVKYRPSTRKFYCSNGARWALDGSVISKPEGSFPDDPLGVLLVRVSLDNHVLVSPIVTMSNTSVDLSNT